MRDEKDERVLPVQVAEAGQSLLVEEQVVPAQHPVAESLPHLAAAVGVVARHLPQVPGCLGEHRLRISPQLVGQPGGAVGEVPVGEELTHLLGVGGQGAGAPGQRRDPAHQRAAPAPDDLVEATHEPSSSTSSKPPRMHVSKTSVSVMASGSTLKPMQQVPS